MSDIVFEQLRELRDSGVVDMLDYRMVRFACVEFDYPELADWLDSHTIPDYAIMLSGEFAGWLRAQIAIERLEDMALEAMGMVGVYRRDM